jgi:NMD protein affecting ribosome stability and mRNA decay
MDLPRSRDTAGESMEVKELHKKAVSVPGGQDSCACCGEYVPDIYGHVCQECRKKWRKDDER